MTNPTAAILVIGDEILSGRTQDTNTHYLAGELTKIGVELKEVRVVSDDQAQIVRAINALRSRYENVFTSGGIGPTHDDITADAVAAAFGRHIDIRDDARAIMAARYLAMGTELNAARLRMARIPDGAVLIDNPVSGAPGFTIENVHVMAGVPAVFHAMVATVLPTLTGGNPLTSETYRVTIGEGDIAGALAALADEFADLSIGSYPFQKDGAFGSQIVIRGAEKRLVGQAMTKLKSIFPGQETE